MTQLSNVPMQPNQNAVERPLTLVEELEQKASQYLQCQKGAEALHDVCYFGGNVTGLVEAINIVKQHQAESDWVSVDERLPSVNLKVLVWHSRKKKFFTATYDRDLKIWLENGLPYSSNFLDSITHWMPLPQPPSEVQA